MSKDEIINNKYRFSPIFWGSFLISLGIGLILFKFISFPVGIISFSTSLAIMLLLLGVSFFNISKIYRQIILSVVGFILSFIVLNFIYSTKIGFISFSDKFAARQRLDQSHESIISYGHTSDSATLIISGTAMDLELSDIHTSAFKLNYNNINTFLVDYDSLSHTYKLNGESKNIIDDLSGPIGKVQISDNILWNIKTNIFSSDFNGNFKNIKVSKAFISANTSDLFLEFGDKTPQTEILIESELSDISINIPHNAYCELSSNIPMSDFKIDDMEEVYSGYYKCGNPDNCTNRIKITVTGQLSDFKISRVR